MIILIRGTHFEGEPHGMMQTARQAAAKRGLSLKVLIHGDTLTLHVSTRTRSK